MDDLIKEELNILKDIILKTVPVQQIYFFGSHADGVPHKDSDLDIYVVMPDNANIRNIDAMMLIRKAIRDKSMPVYILVNTESKFNQRKSTPSIERHIAQKGIVLYKKS